MWNFWRTDWRESSSLLVLFLHFSVIPQMHLLLPPPLRPPPPPPPPPVGPVANATDVLQPSRLIVLTLFPTFPRSPPGTSAFPAMQEIPVAKGGTMWERINRKFCLKLQLPRQFRDLLHAANLRHGTHGFTSLPKEGLIRIFSP